MTGCHCKCKCKCSLSSVPPKTAVLTIWMTGYQPHLISLSRPIIGLPRGQRRQDKQYRRYTIYLPYALGGAPGNWAVGWCNTNMGGGADLLETNIATVCCICSGITYGIYRDSNLSPIFYPQKLGLLFFVCYLLNYVNGRRKIVLAPMLIQFPSM